MGEACGFTQPTVAAREERWSHGRGRGFSSCFALRFLSRSGAEVMYVASATNNLVGLAVGVHYDYPGGTVWLGIGR